MVRKVVGSILFVVACLTAITVAPGFLNTAFACDRESDCYQIPKSISACEPGVDCHKTPGHGPILACNAGDPGCDD